MLHTEPHLFAKITVVISRLIWNKKWWLILPNLLAIVFIRQSWASRTLENRTFGWIATRLITTRLTTQSKTVTCTLTTSILQWFTHAKIQSSFRPSLLNITPKNQLPNWVMASLLIYKRKPISAQPLLWIMNTAVVLVSCCHWVTLQVVVAFNHALKAKFRIWLSLSIVWSRKIALICLEWCWHIPAERVWWKGYRIEQHTWKTHQ